MTKLSFQTFALSAAGERADNQDAFAWRAGLWVLADGLGGHQSGALAAQLAVDAALAVLPPGTPLGADSLEAAVVAAAAALRVRQQSDQTHAGMRTTLAILMSDGIQALWLHLGDTRIYGFRGGRILFQTADHSVPQALVRAGELDPEAIRFHEDRNRLLRTLGDRKPPRPTLAAAPLALVPGDALLLCTDGFWEAVTEVEMLATLAQAPDPQAWLKGMEAILRGRWRSDQDNYTAIAVFVLAP